MRSTDADRVLESVEGHVKMSELRPGDCRPFPIISHGVAIALGKKVGHEIVENNGR